MLLCPCVDNTQVLIMGYSSWIALLQPASFGLAASLVMWAHHIAVVVAGNLAGLPGYAPLNDAVYFGFLAAWSFALWVATRYRDAEAVLERKCEARAAAGAARCRSLVHACLPPTVMADLRERLVQKLPMSVAYSFDRSFLLQSDIVVGYRCCHLLIEIDAIDRLPRHPNDDIRSSQFHI